MIGTPDITEAEQSVGNDHRIHRRILALLLLVVATGAFLSLRDLTFKPHFDELWHIALSTGRGSEHLTAPRNVLIESAPSVTATAGAPPVWRIPGSLATVTHPPLYSMLLRLWRDAFGDSLAVARCLSATFFILSIFVLFDAVRLLHNTTTALWSALLLAVSSAELQTAQQVRNYSCQVFCVLLVIDVVIRIHLLGLSKARIACLLLTTLASLFSHYFSIFALGAIGIYVLLTFRGRKRNIVVFTMVAAFGIYLALWLPMLLAQRDAIDEATYRSPLSTVGEDGVSDGLVRLSLAPLRLLYEPRPPDAIAPRFSGVLLVLPWFLLRRYPKLLLWVLLLDLCVGAVFAMDLARQTKHLSQIRHLIVAGTALSVLIPAMLERERGWLRHGVPAVIVLGCLGALGLPIQGEYRSFVRLGQMAGDPRYRTEPVIFYGDPEALWKSDLNYLALSQFSGTFPRPIIRLTHPLDQHTLEQLHRWPGAILVCEDWQLSSPDIQQNAKLEMIDLEPYLADVAHLTWLSSPSTHPSTTQPTTAAAPR